MHSPGRNRKKEHESPRSPAHGGTTPQNVRECACGRGLACVGMTQAFRMLGDPRCYYVELPRYRKDPPAYKYVFRNNLRAAYLRHLAKQNPNFNAQEFDSSKRRYVALHHFHPTVVRAFYENPLTAAQKHRVPVSITEHEMKQLNLDCNEEDRILSMTGKPTGGYFFVPDYPQEKSHGDLKALIKAERLARDFRAKLHRVARERRRDKQQQAQPEGSAGNGKPTTPASATSAKSSEKSKKEVPADIEFSTKSNHSSGKGSGRLEEADLASPPSKATESSKDPDYSSSDEVDVDGTEDKKVGKGILGADDLDVGVSDEVAASFDDIWNETSTSAEARLTGATETKQDRTLGEAIQEEEPQNELPNMKEDNAGNPLIMEDSESSPAAPPTEVVDEDSPEINVQPEASKSSEEKKPGFDTSEEKGAESGGTTKEVAHTLDENEPHQSDETEISPTPGQAASLAAVEEMIDEVKPDANESTPAPAADVVRPTAEDTAISSGKAAGIDSTGVLAVQLQIRGDGESISNVEAENEEEENETSPSGMETLEIPALASSLDPTIPQQILSPDKNTTLLAQSQIAGVGATGNNEESQNKSEDEKTSSSQKGGLEESHPFTSNAESSSPLLDETGQAQEVEDNTIAANVAPIEASRPIDDDSPAVDVVTDQGATSDQAKGKLNLTVDTSPEQDWEGAFDRPSDAEAAPKEPEGGLAVRDAKASKTDEGSGTGSFANALDAGKATEYLATPSTLDVSVEQFLGPGSKPLDIKFEKGGEDLISPLNTPAGMAVIEETSGERKMDFSETTDSDDKHSSLPSMVVDKSIFKERAASVSDISKTSSLDPPGKTVSFSASKDEEELPPSESRSASPTADGAISLSHQLPGADPTIRIQVHNDLIAWESKRRSNMSASLETLREEWKGAREILRDGVEEVLVAERLVMGFSKAGVLFADSLKAMYEDKMLDNQGNTVTNTFLQNRLMNKRRTQEYSIENASASTAGQGQTGQSSLLNSVVDSQKQLAKAFIESARHMEAEVLVEATEVRTEVQAKANELEAVGESILGEMKRSEMEVKKIWDVFDAMVTGDLMEYSTHGSMHGSFHGSLHGSGHSYGGSSLHGFLNPESPIGSNVHSPMVKSTFKQLGGVEDGWLIEMYYRAAVTYQRSVFDVGENELKNLYKEIVKLEEKRQRRLHEVMLAFVPKQRRLMLGLPEHLNEMLENLVGLRIDEESLQSLIDDSIQERSHTHLKSSFQHKSSIMNRSRLQKDKEATEIEDIEAEFGNPFESSMVRDSRIVELKPGGLGGIVNTNWKPALSVFTSDGNMHIFELPASGASSSSSLEAFRSLYPSMAFDNSLGWVQGRKSDIIRGVTPYQTLFIGKCRMTISNMRKRQFDIVEEGGDSSGRLGGNRLLNAANAQLQKCTMRLPSASDTAEWVAILETAKSEFSGRPGMTKSLSVARKSSRFKINF